MAKPTKSPAAKYIDSLEWQARGARPLTGWRFSFWHAMLGAGCGAFAGIWLSLRPLPPGQLDWTVLLVSALAGAVLFAVGGRVLWNALLARHRAPLLEQVNRNLFDHELLLLCFETELPARYEKLRHAAQSYGKTRARNWAELRKGSMQDRVQWLIENYQVICGILKLPASSPGLRRLRAVCGWLFLAPVALVALPILALVQGWLPRPVAGDAILLSLAVTNVLISVLVGIMAVVHQLERTALLSVLVEHLDSDRLEGGAPLSAEGSHHQAARTTEPPAVN